MEDIFEMRWVGHHGGALRSLESMNDYVQAHKRENARCIGREELYQPGFHVRGSGRSVLIAISLIEKALANPGHFVEYRDHIQIPELQNHLKKHMREKVRTIMKACPEYQHMLENIVVDNKAGFVYMPKQKSNG